MMRASVILLVCLLKHTLSVPMTEFFTLDATTSSTLGNAEDDQCDNIQPFLLGGNQFNGICVSLNLYS